MQNQIDAVRPVPWNKGKLTGAKPPLRPKHVWSIRTKLQMEGRIRDLAMFNLAIDSKLRGGDVVALRVEDVAAGGYTADRATVRQKKTGRPVRFELSEQTRQAVDDYLICQIAFGKSRYHSINSVARVTSALGIEMPTGVNEAIDPPHCPVATKLTRVFARRARQTGRSSG
jgi:integrase